MTSLRRLRPEADHVFEETFRVHQVQQCPIEPHIAIAYWDSDERLVIRTSTQVPVPRPAHGGAAARTCPVKRIRIIKPRIGGGFGAKQEMLIEDIVGHLTCGHRPAGAARADPAEESSCPAGPGIPRRSPTRRE